MNLRRMTIGLLVLLSTSAAHAQNARGIGINIPVVGRLVGGGNTLFRTAVDVANHAGSPTKVDFYFAGQDLTTLAPITITGSVTNAGLVAQGGGTLRGSSVVTLADFVQSLVDAGRMTALTRDHGVLGSVLFVFDGLAARGDASASARFYNDFGGGTVSVALTGRVITREEPVALRAVVRDTRGKPGAQLYSNLFINNTGLAPVDGLAQGDITVEISATANSTGLPVGTPLTLTIPRGQTRSVSQVLTALGVSPSSEETVLVLARVTGGSAAIAGVVSTVDATTRDGAVIEMTRADL